MNHHKITVKGKYSMSIEGNMQVWMFADNIQVEDNAPWDEELGTLYQEFAKVGEIVGPYPTVYVDVKDVSISKDGKINLEELEDKQYKITGEIVDGYLYFGYCDYSIIYLVIDVGFLIRLSIDVPLKHLKIKTDTGYRCVPLTLTEDDEPKSMQLSKGDFITFPAKIWAMWTDMWTGAVDVSFRGKIVDREINEDHSMWLLMEPLPSKKEYKLDSRGKLDQRLADGDMLVEYPTRN